MSGGRPLLMPYRWVPHLARAHRGFFIVVCGLAFVHVVGLLDEALPHSVARHSYKPWAIHNIVLPSAGWASLHVCALVMTFCGVYRTKDLVPLRLSAAMTASIFSLQAISYGIACVKQWPTVTLFGVGYSGFIVLCAIAALLEPGVNPASDTSHRQAVEMMKEMMAEAEAVAEARGRAKR